MPVRKAKGGYRWGSMARSTRPKPKLRNKAVRSGLLGIRERSNGRNFTIINCWSESR